MKNKTKKLWIASLCSVGIVAFATGCALGSKVSESDFKGFEVENQITVEIGQYYTPEIPNVTLNGESVHVSVSAKRGTEELYFNGDNALLVEGFEDIQIIYTIVENGVKLEKSTLVKIQDTTAPYIVTTTLPEKIYRGEIFEYADYIRIGDLSGECNSSITITDQTGAAIETKDGAFTLAEDSAVSEVTFAISATDGKDNAVNKQIKIPVKDLTYFTNPFDFNSIDISKVTSQINGTTVEAVEKDGKNAVKISADLAWQNITLWSAAHFTFIENFSNYATFDYVKVTASAETNVDLVVYGAGTEFKVGDTSVKEMVYDMSHVKELNNSVIRNEKYLVNIALLCGRTYETVPEAVDMDFYIYDIELGFYERQVANDTPIDLSAFGVTADDVVSAKFMPVDGAESSIDVKKFIPNENGKLTLTVKKSGYRTTTFVVDIIPTQIPVEEDNTSDNDVEFIW